jgi:hypothetical protein
MDAQMAFRHHALSDGVMDDDERAVDEALMEAQQIVGETHEEILSYVAVIRTGRHSNWRRRSERQAGITQA